MTLEERCDAVAAALQQDNLPEAEVHLRVLAREVADPQFRDDLQTVVKVQHTWIAIARLLGFLPPGRFGPAALLYAIITTGALVILMRLVVRPEAADVAVPMLVGLAALVTVGHIGDCLGTIALRARGDHLAVTAGDATGAGVRIGILFVAIACGLAFVATHTVTWVAAALLSFVTARAVHHALSLRLPLARALLGAYVGVGVLLGLVAVVSIAREVPSGDLAPPWSLWSGLPALASVALLTATRWVRPIVMELVGTGLVSADDGSFATRPGGIPLSDHLLRSLHPELYGWRGLLLRWTHDYGQSAADLRTRVREALGFGDAQPAVVVQVEPLLIAAYSDELDAAVLLSFPQELAGRFELARGKRLVSINTYYPMQYRSLGNDVEFGEESTGRWGNFAPHIANFLCEDEAALQALLRRITAEEWDRLKLRVEQQARRGHPPRDGRPLFCAESRLPVPPG